MSNDKQSSVEYFHDAVNDIIANKRPCNSNEVAKILLEAKAMHKDEIIDALLFGDVRFLPTAENYYKVKFGGNDEPDKNN